MPESKHPCVSRTCHAADGNFYHESPYSKSRASTQTFTIVILSAAKDLLFWGFPKFGPQETGISAAFPRLGQMWGCACSSQLAKFQRWRLSWRRRTAAKEITPAPSSSN